MSVLESPNTQPGDDLDNLLRAYFRRQLPQPWPAPRLSSAVMSNSHRPARGRNLMRSRWALAASVALLLFASWIMPGRFTNDSKPDHGPNGPMINNIPPDMPRGHKRHKQVENKNRPGLATDEDDQLPQLDGSEMEMLRWR